MSSLEELGNALKRRISEINNKLSKANNKIVDGVTQEKRTAASVRKLKFQYGKIQLENFLMWVTDLAEVEEKTEARITELEDHRQEILNAISEADFEVLRAERTDGGKGNLYLSPLNGNKAFTSVAPPVEMLQSQIARIDLEFPQPYTEIMCKRQEQDRRWGGPEHDDTHSYQEWAGFIDKQMTQLYSKEDPDEMWNFRERMLDVAALAVAAIEAYDRHQIKEKAEQASEMESKEPFEAKSSTISYEEN